MGIYTASTGQESHRRLGRVCNTAFGEPWSVHTCIQTNWTAARKLKRCPMSQATPMMSRGEGAQCGLGTGLMEIAMHALTHREQLPFNRLPDPSPKPWKT